MSVEASLLARRGSAALLSACSVALAAASASAGTFGVTTITNDGDSGISDAITYTNAVNFGPANPDNTGAAPAVTINDVTFSGDSAGGTGPTGVTFAITQGLDTRYVNRSGQGAPTTATGNVASLLNPFRYTSSGGNARIALSGLTVGTTYKTRLYATPFGGDRLQKIVAGNTDTRTNYDFSNAPQSLDYTFTATSPYHSLALDANNDPASYHVSGFSNEVVSAAPAGTVYVTGLYATGVNDAGAPLAAGAVDTHYDVDLPGGTVDYAAVDPRVANNQGAYNNTGDSQFINEQGNAAANSPGGQYRYRTTSTSTRRSTRPPSCSAAACSWTTCWTTS